MAKTYNHKKRRRNYTRKSGGAKSSLYNAMSKGREEANKHYERSMKAYQPYADKLVSDVNKQYKKQKYKNTSNFAAAKADITAVKSKLSAAKASLKTEELMVS